MAEGILVNAFLDPERTRRVAISRRLDGNDYFAEEERCDLSHEPCDPRLEIWLPTREPNPSGIYDSPETALREAAFEIAWLRTRRDDSSE